MGLPLLAAAVVGLSILGFANHSSSPGRGSSLAKDVVSAEGGVPVADSPRASAGNGSLSLATTDSPGAVCVSPYAACPAGTDVTRVTITASAPTGGVNDWPATQVLFVLETTPYDGTFDWHSTGETSWDGQEVNLALCFPVVPLQLCGESNSVGAFAANATPIARAIQAAHPGSAVTFGLVDYFATHDAWGNANGSEYHVDVGTFVPADGFQGAVDRTLWTQVLNDSPILVGSGLGENFLHSSSITALYGALSGAGIGWSNDTHHVIVWIGSTAPRDPGYVVNYCVSESLHANRWATNVTGAGCYSSGCEPAYTFGPSLRSPECEGWVTSQDGNAGDSIAAYAQSAPACVNSLGGSCTVDTIEVPGGGDWGGSMGEGSPYMWQDNGTQPKWNLDGVSGCLNWGTHWAGGNCTPGGLIATKEIWQNVNHTRNAACDLATATGGTWDGPRTATVNLAQVFLPKPAFWTAPEACHGTSGDLEPPAWLGTTLWTTPETCTSYVWPYCDTGTEYFNTTNPSLVAALARVGFGAAPYALAARGVPGAAMFTFVPFGNVRLAPYLGVEVTCEARQPLPGGCDPEVGRGNVGATAVLTFNWSGDPSLNVLQAGDTWAASFDLVGVGPPFNIPVAVDACTTPGCGAAGSRAVDGVFSEASYLEAANGTPVVASFPVAEVIVENVTESAPPTSSPPSAPPGGQAPPLPAPAPLPAPVTQPVPVATASGLAGAISIPAAAAGVLVAGLTRVLLRGRATRLRVPVRVASRVGRKGGTTRGMDDGPPSRFE